ncbi:HNH endonuclease [Sphingomonas glaciei]|uniref:HNH endonuclease n=1 Tax=Sphingomonas glaciei TaxID=2938948 RepID=A0ABY5N0B6_9SPHN|nr:HNH endonuclease signature motif containing protein [Sphingomonas glaciei]UUR09506.1 HNH endonuclease [Sphingomonas glaciei]
MKRPGLGAIHEKILELLKGAPQGLDVHEIREHLGGTGAIGDQQHLDKRIRELRDYYHAPRRKVAGRWVYVYEGERGKAAADDGKITPRVRAEVLHRAHQRCQMCGRTVGGDGVKLQVDHKIPRTWGGATVSENLWALCEACNQGKRDYFSSFNDAEMQEIMSKESVYERIAETLRLHAPEPTPSWLLEFVANFDDFQDDWQKRLRELRYPVIGMVIPPTLRKLPSGKREAAYRLEKWVDLPANHKFLIKEHERLTKAANAKRRLSGEAK